MFKNFSILASIGLLTACAPLAENTQAKIIKPNKIIIKKIPVYQPLPKFKKRVLVWIIHLSLSKLTKNLVSENR